MWCVHFKDGWLNSFRKQVNIGIWPFSVLLLYCNCHSLDRNTLQNINCYRNSRNFAISSWYVTCLFQVLHPVNRFSSWLELSRWNWMFVIGYVSLWIQEVNIITNQCITSDLISKEVVQEKCCISYMLGSLFFKAEVWKNFKQFLHQVQNSGGILQQPASQIEILEYLVTMKMKLTGNQVENSTETAMNLKLEWICSNLYPLSGNAIKKRISNEGV